MSTAQTGAEAFLMEKLAAFDSATISNAIESFNVESRRDGFVDGTIGCLYPELPPMVGRAVTCVVESSDRSLSMPNRLADLLDLLHDGDGPRVVVLESRGDSWSRICVIGDLMAGFLWRLGVTGIVSDSCARDIDTIQSRAPGLSIFARGMISSHSAGIIVDVQCPVRVGGLLVHPGDILHGDRNGVVHVPEEIAQRVPDGAAAVLAREARLHESLEGDTLDFALARDTFIH
jgi:4-hydroxy-4-methyl-2-oxoglutarate aldolase